MEYWSSKDSKEALSALSLMGAQPGQMKLIASECMLVSFENREDKQQMTRELLSFLFKNKTLCPLDFDMHGVRKPHLHTFISQSVGRSVGVSVCVCV